LADIFRFARSLWGSELLTYLMSKMDNVVVGTLGASALGLYAFGEDNSSFATLGVASVIAQVTLPALAKVQGRIDEFRRTYLDMLRLTASVSMPMQVGALVIADIMIPLAFGGQWEAAVPVFRAYVLFQIFDSLTMLSNAAMSACGRPHIRLRINLIQFPFFVAAAWFGLSVWGGILGVALSLAIVRSLAALVYLIITWRILHLPAREVIRALAPSTLAAGLMGLAALGVRAIGPANEWWLLAAVVGAAVPVYGGLLWLIDRSAFAQVWDAGMQIFVPLRLRGRLARRFPRLKRILSIQA
jgi:PST family polysaccharide transporter